MATCLGQPPVCDQIESCDEDLLCFYSCVEVATCDEIRQEANGICNPLSDCAARCLGFEPNPQPSQFVANP